MGGAHVIRLVMGVGYLLIALWCLRDPKRHLPFAGASACVAFLLTIGQLTAVAKDAMGFMDGLALILMGVACGLILSEAVRGRIAEKRPGATGTVEA